MSSDKRLLLQTEQLEIRRGDRPLISGLDVSGTSGDIIHVTGPNGSGKTTLLRCLVGLTLPDSGSYRWFGRRFTTRPDDATRARIHYQGHKDGLKGGLTPSENLYSLDALRSGDIRLPVTRALESAGMAHRESLACRFLSAGQRRRTRLAGLLLRHADVWVLDEPFTSLDADGIAMVTGWIRDHAAYGGMVLLSSHQPLAAGLVTQELRLEGAQ